MTIPPVTPSPDDKETSASPAPLPDQTDSTAPANDSTCDGSESTSDSRTDKEAEKIIDVFSNSPYITPEQIEKMEGSPDEVVKATKQYRKESKKSKQHVEETQEKTEQTIQSYAPPDSSDPTQTSKQKGS